MNSAGEYHQRAMENADRAMAARGRGDEEQASTYFRAAFVDEKRAAEIVAPDLTAEPSRSVLHRSAAALAVECGEAREAERLIAIALAGDPPEEIADELRDLWRKVCCELIRVPAATTV
jgi:hypothetical protein